MLKSKRLWSSVAAVALTLCVAESAGAVVTVTYQGTVASGSYDDGIVGYDRLGLFGTPGARLIGDSYTAVYTVDDSLTSEEYFDPYDSYIIGGSSWGPTSVIATLTINGVTLLVPGDSESLAAVSAFGLGNPYESDIADVAVSGPVNQTTSLWQFMGSTTYPVVSNFDFRVSSSYTAHPGDGVNGSFFSFTPSSYEELILDAKSVTAVGDRLPGPNIPEPTTWAMLILGIAMVGYVARRRGASIALMA